MAEPTKPAIDSPEVLARLTEGLDLVDLVARQLRRQFGPYVQYDDLVSQGREALLAAARSFDPERGLVFRRWANLRVRGAMIDSVRSGGIFRGGSIASCAPCRRPSACTRSRPRSKPPRRRPPPRRPTRRSPIS